MKLFPVCTVIIIYTIIYFCIGRFLNLAEYDNGNSYGVEVSSCLVQPKQAEPDIPMLALPKISITDEPGQYQAAGSQTKRVDPACLLSFTCFKVFSVLQWCLPERLKVALCCSLHQWPVEHDLMAAVAGRWKWILSLLQPSVFHSYLITFYFSNLNSSFYCCSFHAWLSYLIIFQSYFFPGHQDYLCWWTCVLCLW